MTPEAQRIAIAEACGWTPFLLRNGEPMTPPRWLHPNGEMVHTIGTMPSYLSDLNAMHEAEMVLTREQWFTYVYTLRAILPIAEHNDVRATAAQRAEAFLRTLNLWTK